MQEITIAPHETFEVHELLTFKTVCANKTAMMAQMVSDAQLKGILQNDLNETKAQIQELKDLLAGSQFIAGGQSGRQSGIDHDTSVPNVDFKA